MCRAAARLLDHARRELREILEVVWNEQLLRSQGLHLTGPAITNVWNFR